MEVNYNLSHFMRDDARFVEQLIKKAFEKEFGLRFNLVFNDTRPQGIKINHINEIFKLSFMRLRRRQANRMLNYYTSK